MKLAGCIVWLGCLLLATAGCRRDPMLSVYIDEVNAEKRMLENRLNDMQFELEAKEREIERLKKQVRGGSSGENRSAEPEGLPVPRIDVPPPRSEENRNDSEAPDLELVPPTIEPGEKSQSQNGPRRPSHASGTEGTPVGLRRGSSQVADLAIDATQTAGVALDDQPGDDGLRVFFQPRDGDGDYLPVAAPVEIELLEQATGRSVAMWEYSTNEIELALSRANVYPGILLQMRLPRKPRSERRYRLVVRYGDPRNRPITREALISLEPTAPTTSSWTPRRSGDASIPESQGEVVREATPRELPTQAPVAEPLGAPPSPEASRPQWRPYR